MNRLTLRIFIAFSILSPAASNAAFASSEAAGGGRRISIKHVLMIVSDDLRPEVPGLSKLRIQTPNLDLLAARSIRYSRAYCNYPQCMPSRSSVMTGLRPPDFVLRVEQLATKGEPTLPNYLRQHGIKTMTVGKVYHDTLDDLESWDLYDRSLLLPGANRKYNWDSSDYQLKENKERQRVKEQLSFVEQRESLELLPPLFERADVPEAGYIDYRTTTIAEEWIQQHAGSEQGLFLAVGMMRPHLPWTAPEKYWALYNPADIDVAENPFFPSDGVGKSDLVDLMTYSDPEVQEKFTDFDRYMDADFPVLSEDKQRQLIHAYAASVSFMDAQVGRLLAALEQAGMADETAVLFWGDHGYHLGEHKLWTKVTQYDVATRVPLILFRPGRAKGHECSEIVELVDIYPTICELFGLAAPSHVDGSSLPMEEGEKGKGYAYINLSHGHTKMESHSLVTDRYRFTRYEGVDPRMMISGRGNFELFDHAVDPSENINLARKPEFQALLQELEAQLRKVTPALR